MEEEVIDDFGSQEKAQKQRHGCVTAWLVMMIVVNGALAVLYLAFSELFLETLLPDGDSPKIWLYVLVGLSASNVVFAAMLLKWKKIGFYGFVGTSLLAFALNLYIGGDITQALYGLVGIGILLAVLRIKNKYGHSAWEGLE